MNKVWNFLQIVWSFPNQLFGLLGCIGGRVLARGISPRYWIVSGSWLCRSIRGTKWASAITLGDCVFVAHPNTLQRHALIAHERVHTLQSRLLGPFYLPLTLLGYLWSGVTTGFRDWHDASPLEVDADRRSGFATNVERNRKLASRRH